MWDVWDTPHRGAVGTRQEQGASTRKGSWSVRRVGVKWDEVEHQGGTILWKEGVGFKNKRGDVKTREVTLHSFLHFLSQVSLLKTWI